VSWVPAAGVVDAGPMLTIQNPDGASLAAPGPLANRLDPTPKAEQRGAAPQTPATAVTKLRRTLRSPAAAGCTV
jgi:hypothetical protein